MQRHLRWVAIAIAVTTMLSLAVTPRAQASPLGVRASYATPVRRADGHVDSPATVARLQAMNANTYAFLVLGPYDWDDLRGEFAPAAQAAGIDVWVYLVPPSECPGGTTCADYAPYRKDYAAWARAIGQLSLTYPVVRAWAIDDFNHNATFFTARYTSQIRAAGRAVQPTLELYPVVYHGAITQSFVDAYAPGFDAVIMPYRDDPYRNTLWTGTLRSQLDTASAQLARRGRQLILMPYVLRLSLTRVPPDVEYVREVTAVGLEYTRAGRIAGVVQYALNLSPGRPQADDPPVSHGTGRGALMLTVMDNQATSAGDWAAARATIRLDPGSTSCRLSLWHTDDRTTTAPTGYHVKQALVAGTVVWQRDVASEGTDWYTASTVDVTARLVDGAAALVIRLYELNGVSNYGVTARIDDIQLTGCSTANPGFETTGGWTYTRSGGRVLAGQHTHDPEYSTTVYDTVAALYGAAA
jgi:hypothetical protein